MMTEQLVHYSGSPVSQVLSVEQEDHPHFKPRGFWLSVDGNDDGWKEWCEGERFAPAKLTHIHDVILFAKANILRLKNSADILAFDAEYKSELAQGISYFSIDWKTVARKYQGIIIAPYVWEQRLSLDAQWYYAWDCASGCIWDADAIESITLRRPTFTEYCGREGLVVR